MHLWIDCQDIRELFLQGTEYEDKPFIKGFIHLISSDEVGDNPRKLQVVAVYTASSLPV